MPRSGYIYIVFCMLPAFIMQVGHAQNLVPNCEFEDNTGCPNGQGQLSKCRYWNSPGGGTGTPDYVHSCNSGNFSVPFNQWGNQAARSGNAYAHIIAYYPSQGNFSEYIQIALACEMLAGESYEVSFFVSLSDQSHYAIDGIGAFLSDTPLVQSLNDFIDINGAPYVSTPPGDVLDNKNGWTKVGGTYSAVGGEKYLCIGNFTPVSNLTIEDLANGNTFIASYYVEDVGVTSLVPLIDLGSDTTICPNDSVTLDLSNYCSSATLTWNDGSTDLVRKLGPGFYSVEGEIGCDIFYDEVTIFGFSDPGHFLPGDTVICPNQTLEIIPGGSFNDYLWQDGNDQPTYTTDTEGLYWLQVTDANTCAFRDSIDVSSMLPPAFSLGQDTIICTGNEIRLDPDIDSAFNHFLWSNYSQGLTLLTSDSGEYWLHVVNPCGEMSDTMFLSTNNCDPAIAAPNAFTPNGDGRNDVFQVKAENIQNFQIYVYDRWGTLLFESKDLQQGWDGKFNGELCPAGAYVWMAVYDVYDESGRKKTENVKGTLVLLR
jgi:gliding motility-associated-like protein